MDSKKTWLSIFLFFLILIFSSTYALDGNADRDLLFTILFSIRLPRVVLVCLCGASLSAAGVLSQGLFRNSLASPSILGVNSGGVLGAILVYSLCEPWHYWYLIPMGSFLSCLFSMALLLFLFQRIKGRETGSLLILGFCLTTFFGALTSLLMSFLLPQMERLSSLLRWMMGGFHGRSWEHVMMCLPFFCLASVFSVPLLRKLDVLNFGEEIAETLNINIQHLQRLCIVLMSLFVSSSVSVSGLVPFVGLIVPHMTRSIFGPSHTKLFYLSMLNGMSLLLFADFLSQHLMYPEELQVGIFSSLLGSLVFFKILLGNKHVFL